jgi:hypothetical protein
MSQDSKPDGEKPSSMHHAFRISLNLTRRIVRRMIELEQVQHTYVWKPVPRQSNVPDAVSFQFSLRILRRVVHRVMEQQAELRSA